MSNEDIEVEEEEIEVKKFFYEKFWNPRPEVSLRTVVKVVLTIFSFPIFLTILSTHYSFYQSILLSFTLTCLLLSLFSSRFRKPFRTILSKKKVGEEFVEVNPLKDLSFYLYKNIEDVLFAKSGLNLIAYAGLEVVQVPIGVRGNFEGFIRSIYAEKIPIIYFYQHEPIEEEKIPHITEISREARNAMRKMEKSELRNFISRLGGVWKAKILLITRSKALGLFRTSRVAEQLAENVKSNIKKIEAIFTSAFPHCKLEILRGLELEGAIRCVLTGEEYI